MRKAVFLDRDGTIIADKGYLSDPAEIAFLPGVIDALRQLQQMGYLLVVVSNQSGIGRGYFTEDRYLQVQEQFRQLLSRRGIKLDGIYYCPHGPEEACGCRKPAIGMALQAAADLNIDLAASCMVGDKDSDLEFGRNFGAKKTCKRISELLELIRGPGPAPGNPGEKNQRSGQA
jgi:D,D-heptose 1,7-bisphosphate phosphatase